MCIESRNIGDSHLQVLFQTKTRSVREHRSPCLILKTVSNMTCLRDLLYGITEQKTFKLNSQLLNLSCKYSNRIE